MLAPRCVIVPAKLRAQRKQVETWQSSELMDFNAKVVIYEAFVEKVEAEGCTRTYSLPSPLDTALHHTVRGSHSVAPRFCPRS